MGYSMPAGPLARSGLWRRSWPFIAAGLVAFIMLVLPQTDISDRPAIYAAAILTVALVGISLLPWERMPRWPQAVVPLGFLGVIALVREATGGTAGFAVLVMLPVLWLALYGTRGQLILSVVLSTLVFLVPILVIGSPTYPPSGAGRIILWPVTAAIVGGTTYRLVAAERARAAFIGGMLSAATQQSIIATDPAGVITVFNTGAERMTGHRAADMIGSARLTDLHDPKELQARSSELVLLAGPEIPIGKPGDSQESAREWTYLAKDGRRIQADVSISPIRNDAGTLQGFISVGTDITERRAAEKLKDEFVALVSHELRTPLSSIIGYIELLLDEEESGSLSTRQRHFLDVVDRNARRQLRLVSDLLFVSQVDAGRVQLVLADVDLTEVARSAVEGAQPRAKAAGVRVSLHADASLPVRADGDRLAQVFDNLITNALKFTPPPGRVDIRVARRENTAVIEVADTGIGIPTTEQQSLFSRFFRASTATSRAIPGIGLGLTIVKAIVEEHGGTISHTSVERVGTTFRIEMPVEQ